MSEQIAIHGERWLLKSPFRIARGVKTAAEVIVVEVRRGDRVGRGEALPYARYDETVDSAMSEAAMAAAQAGDGLDRRALLDLMAPGAARNALDAALWDLEAQITGRSVAAMLETDEPGAIETAVTISLDEPDAMAEAAAELADVGLLKVKVGDQDPMAAIEAVRRAAPGPRLIVDPNESWTFAVLREFLPEMAALKVDLVEQPLPAGQDEELEGFEPLVPLCADESAHVSADLDQVSRRYQVVNIKLDKTGGLTEALQMRDEALRRGLGLMVGCMVSTSLSIAPALHLAQNANFVDLDGPWWLATDRLDGHQIKTGRISPSLALWGQGAHGRS